MINDDDQVGAEVISSARLSRWKEDCGTKDSTLNLYKHGRLQHTSLLSQSR
jgi:hypothetical protein